jgi:cytochrome c oxidase subunit 1
MRWMPWLALAGLLAFGAAGVAAGYLGVPRRVIDVAYQSQAPAVWQTLMATVGIGGVLMGAALALFATGVAVSLLPRRQAAPDADGLTVAWGDSPLQRASTAWVGPLSVLVIVVAMYGFTTIGFEMMQSLPVTAAGAGGH